MQRGEYEAARRYASGRGRCQARVWTSRERPRAARRRGSRAGHPDAAPGARQEEPMSPRNFPALAPVLTPFALALAVLAGCAAAPVANHFARRGASAYRLAAADPRCELRARVELAIAERAAGAGEQLWRDGKAADLVAHQALLAEVAAAPRAPRSTARLTRAVRAAGEIRLMRDEVGGLAVAPELLACASARSAIRQLHPRAQLHLRIGPRRAGRRLAPLRARIRHRRRAQPASTASRQRERGEHRRERWEVSRAHRSSCRAPGAASGCPARLPRGALRAGVLGRRPREPGIDLAWLGVNGAPPRIRRVCMESSRAPACLARRPIQAALLPPPRTAPARPHRAGRRRVARSAGAYSLAARHSGCCCNCGERQLFRCSRAFLRRSYMGMQLLTGRGTAGRIQRSPLASLIDLVKLAISRSEQVTLPRRREGCSAWHGLPVRLALLLVLTAFLPPPPATRRNASPARGARRFNGFQERNRIGERGSRRWTP